MPHQVGHIIAKTFYARVKRSGLSGDWVPVREMVCQDLSDQRDFKVVGEDLAALFVSADAWESEEVVTKTELARKLVEAGALPFTVCFLKARGQERTLRGRLLEHQDLLGRSLVHDFDVEKGSPFREVDHRTLQWLILDNVRYTLKGK